RPDVDDGVTGVDPDALRHLEARAGGGEHARGEQDREGTASPFPGERPLLEVLHGALMVPVRQGRCCLPGRGPSCSDPKRSGGTPWTSKSVPSCLRSTATSP